MDDSFIPRPRDRLEAPICNAIEAKDFKQALRLVEKRLAKNSDPYLKALKCYVQCCHPLITERGKAMGTILELPKLTGENRTEEELELWDEAVRVLFPSRQGPEAKAICRLRVEAVKASPKDESLALACFQACLKRRDIESIQSIAISMEKQFPNNHAYHLWRVVTTFQISISKGSPDIDLKTCTGLAYMLIKKYAATTSTADGAQPLPVKSIQTPQELLLLHRILSTQGKLAESLDVFKDPHLGPNSKVSKGEWVFHIKHLKLLELCGEWKGLLAKSFQLLSASRIEDDDGNFPYSRGSDWVVWKALIQAVLELQTPAVVEAISQEVQEHLVPKPQTQLNNRGVTGKVGYARKMNRRNATLALLEFIFADPPLLRPQEGFRLMQGDPKCHPEFSKPGYAVKISRVTLLSAYLDEYKHTTSGFGDVRKFIEKLNHDEMKVILTTGILLELFREENDTKSFTKRLFEKRHELLDAEKITAGITSLKLEYLMKIGDKNQKRVRAGREVCGWCSEPFNSEDESCNYCLRHIVIQALHAYGSAIDDHENVGQKLLPTDKHPADDWAILAAMCLLKLAGRRVYTAGRSKSLFQNEDVQHILQAASVLEYAHSNSKANPHVSLLLVRLYSHIGAGSLALRAYSRLGIKQIQGDTLSYVMFDRISSLHPHSVTAEFSGASEELDPAFHLEKLQRLYRAVKAQINVNTWRSFENGSYDSIFQLMEASDALYRSITSAMSVIESRKVNRLTNPNYTMSKDSHGFDMLSPMMSDEMFSDNCDYSCFPNFERTENPTFESYIRLGPGPSSFRTHALLIVEELWNFCKPPTEAAMNGAFLRLKHVRDNSLYWNIRDSDNLREYVTESEAFLIAVSIHLIEIVYEHCDPIEAVANKIEGSIASKFDLVKDLIVNTIELLKVVEEDLELARVEDWIPSFGGMLHPTYTAYETGTLALSVAEILLKTGSFAQPEAKLNAQSMKGLANELHEKVFKIAKKTRSFVNENAWLDWILDRLRYENIHNSDKSPRADPAKYTISHSIMRVVGHQFCENWAGEIMDSWRESVMGFACLKKGGNSIC